MGTYGGPAVAKAADIEGGLVTRFVETRRGSGVHEVGFVDFHNRFSFAQATTHKAITHIIDMEPGFDHVWSTLFEKSKRRQTRKAEREGIDVVQASSPNDVREYYALYRQQVGKWKPRLVYPETLFLKLINAGDNNVRLFLARANGRLLGGHLNLYFGDTVVAWSGVTTSDSRSLQASTLLYSTCIRHACDKGYTRYNLGGSLDKETLMEYKEALGGTAYSYQVHRWRSALIRGASLVRRLLRRSSE